MNNGNKYQLYVGNHCISCEKIMAYLQEKDIAIPTINIDIEDYSSPIPLLIVPALLKNDKLIGYGEDIKNYFEKTS